MPPLVRPVETRSRWLLAGRLGWAAVLASAALLAGRMRYVESAWPLLAVAGAIVLYGFALALLARDRLHPRTAATIGFSLDVILFTVFLHFSGDIENPLMFGYALPVIGAALIVDRWVALGVATGAAVSFALLVACTFVDAMPVHLPHHHLALLHDSDLHIRIDPDLHAEGVAYIVTHIVVLGTSLFLCALGFGTLSDRVRRDAERVAHLLNQLPEGVALVSKDGAVLESNASARSMLPGLQEGHVRAYADAFNLTSRLALVDRGPVEFETSVDGRILGHAIVRGADPRDPFVWVFRDLTRERRLLTDATHNSKMADLGLLAAGIAHEIGNPLSSMSAILQILRMKEPPRELADRLRSLTSSVDRIHRIVQTIVGYARPSGNNRTSTEAALLVEKAIRIARFHEKAREVKIDVVRPDAALNLRVVEDQIVQVLLNLLLNAADASQGTGTIRVELARNGHDVTLAVIDRGAGMTDEVRRHLFTPFFTTKEEGKGTGLGLFLSESLVRAHGGRIDVDSAPAGGSTFRVILPLDGEEE